MTSTATSSSSSKPAGLLTIPLELRLDIYKELLTPDCAACSESWAPSPEGHTHEKYNFPVSVLCVNSQINQEAKIIFYGANPFSCAIDTYDLCQPELSKHLDTDGIRRINMLPYVTRAQVHIEMSGEVVWESKFSRSSPFHRAAIEYIHHSVAEICRDFEQAQNLKEVEISFHDKLYLQSLGPDVGDEEEDGGKWEVERLWIARSELGSIDKCCYEYVLEGLGQLRGKMAVKVGSVGVEDKTDERTEGRVQELEEKVTEAIKG